MFRRLALESSFFSPRLITRGAFWCRLQASADSKICLRARESAGTYKQCLAQQFWVRLFSQSWLCIQFTETTIKVCTPTFLFSLSTKPVWECDLVDQEIRIPSISTSQGLTDGVKTLEECIMIQESSAEEMLPIRLPLTLQCSETHANSSVINVVILRGTFNWSETFVS